MSCIMISGVAANINLYDNRQFWFCDCEVEFLLRVNADLNMTSETWVCTACVSAPAPYHSLNLLVPGCFVLKRVL